MKIYIATLIIFITAAISYGFVLSEEKTPANDASTNITENSYNLQTNFNIGNKYSTIKLEGGKVVENSGSQVFEYIPDDRYKKPNPFRYTEVSFFITIPFIYTYSTLATFLFDSFQSINVSDRNRSAYKSLKTSQLLFTLLGSSVCAAGVAYANYQRVYGKKNAPAVSIMFAPYADFSNKRTDTGFMFSFSYPYK